MNISASEVRFDDDAMWVGLADGRTVGVPLAWFPKLLGASAADRENFTIGRHGIHWEELDEDVSIEGLLAGRGDRTARRQQAVQSQEEVREAALKRIR